MSTCSDGMCADGYNCQVGPTKVFFCVSPLNNLLRECLILYRICAGSLNESETTDPRIAPAASGPCRGLLVPLSRSPLISAQLIAVALTQSWEKIENCPPTPQPPHPAMGLILLLLLFIYFHLLSMLFSICSGKGYYFICLCTY